jgi:hypothetical protein
VLYFWAVAKEGSITRAAERLGLSVQTISTQLGQFERQLGQALFAPQGCSLMLTEAGRTANFYFHLDYVTSLFGHLAGLVQRSLQWRLCGSGVRRHQADCTPMPRVSG